MNILDYHFSKCVSNFKTNGTFTLPFNIPLLLLRESLQTSGKNELARRLITLNIGKRVEPWIDQEVIKYIVQRKIFYIITASRIYH